jgi:putative oxidoreductase
MAFFNRIAAFLDAIPYALIALFLRIVAAHPFFVSGQTKIEGPTIDGEHLGLDMTIQIPTGLRDAVIALFAEEYKLPYISPEYAAYLTAALEFVLPILLVLGLATRFSAFGLLAITLVIQLFVYPDAWWTAHSYWTALLIVLIARGPGALSLDYLLFGRPSRL